MLLVARDRRLEVHDRALAVEVGDEVDDPDEGQVEARDVEPEGPLGGFGR